MVDLEFDGQELFTEEQKLLLLHPKERRKREEVQKAAAGIGEEGRQKRKDTKMKERRNLQLACKVFDQGWNKWMEDELKRRSRLEVLRRIEPRYKDWPSESWAGLVRK